jgi:hypothetical protein
MWKYFCTNLLKNNINLILYFLKKIVFTITNQTQVDQELLYRVI